MNATTARETLHGWIDDADDATAISLAELLASLTTRGLLAQAKPQPDRVAVPFTMKVDEAPAQPQTAGDKFRLAVERSKESDRLAHAANINRIIQASQERADRQATERKMISIPFTPLPPADDDEKPKMLHYTVRTVSKQDEDVS